MAIFSSISEVREYIYHSLDESSYLHAEKYLIVADALKVFDLSPFETNEVTIEKACCDFLNAQKIRYSGNGVDFFFHQVLNFKDLPDTIHTSLIQTANDDLMEIVSLLGHYQQQEIVKRMTANPNEHPRNHTEKTIFEFYSRTKNKKDEIEKFISTESYSIAIKGAKNKGEILQSFIEKKGWFATFYKQREFFTYKNIALRNMTIVCELDFEFLDYRKINLWRHKNEVYRFKYDISDEKLFPDIENEIKISYPATDRLNELYELVKKIPIIQQREEVFNELKQTYSEGLFYSFYALAMPQVEGIFTEVLRDALKENLSGKALPDKVARFKDLQKSDYNTLDYFQFKFPEYRNKFAHIGIDKDIEFKCKSILLDLEYLVKACAKLDSPSMRIYRFMKDASLKNTSILDFAKLLQNIKEVQKDNEPNYLDKILPDFQTYLDGELILYWESSSFLQKLKEDWNKAYEDFQLLLYYILVNQNIEENAAAMNMTDFVKAFKGIDITEINYYLIVCEQFTLLVRGRFLFKTIGETLNINKRMRDEIEQINKDLEEPFKRIHYLEINANLEKLNDEFLITGKDWQHFEN